MTFVVWLDLKSKWHCVAISPTQDSCFDRLTSDTAKAMVNRVKNPWEDEYAIASFAIHASNRYSAIKLAKDCYKTTLLKVAVNA